MLIKFTLCFANISYFDNVLLLQHTQYRFSELKNGIKCGKTKNFTYPSKQRIIYKNV